MSLTKGNSTEFYLKTSLKFNHLKDQESFWRLLKYGL